jgi:acyl-coenzyme A synthetase/AMP-(fatty) acid ligase
MGAAPNLGRRRSAVFAMAVDPLLNAFETLVRSRPDHPLVRSSERSVTVGEVDSLARAICAGLARQQLAPGSLVALAVANGPGFPAALLALRRLGSAVLLLDWHAPSEELQRIARVLGARGLLHSRSPWPGGAAEIGYTDLVGPDDPDLTVLPDEIAVVKLTSGSTGAPRGILASTDNILSDEDALARSMSLGSSERVFAAIPMSHSYGFASVVVASLVRGWTMVVRESAGPFDTLDVARADGVTFLPTVPAHLQTLLKMSQPPRLPDSVRLVITAGAPLRPETAVRFREVYGLPVRVFYGASECGGITFDRDGSAGERGTLGTPVEGVGLTLQPTADESTDDQGVVTVTSGAVCQGYFPDPDGRLAGGRFITSDLGSLRNGELVLMGRVDDLINVRGKKVSPREVEGVLSELEGVEEAVVVGVPAADGSGETVRAVVAGRAETIRYDTVVAWCRQRLATHKVPRSVILVETIPRNARGKLDRAALRALAPQHPGETE